MTYRPPGMRGLRTIVEQLIRIGGTRFVLVVALIAGTIKATPGFMLGSAAPPLGVLPFLVVGGTTLLWWIGALLLWWVAVRRRASAWIVASQITLSVVLADLLTASLGMVSASLDTGAEVATAVVEHFATFLTSNLGIALMRAPLLFVGSIAAVAIGRALEDPRNPSLRPTRAPTEPGTAV